MAMMIRMARIRGSLMAAPVSRWSSLTSPRLPPPILPSRWKSVCQVINFGVIIIIFFVRFVSSDSSGERVPSLSEEDLLPRYVPRVGETEAVKRARLLYQSRY